MKQGGVGRWGTRGEKGERVQKKTASFLMHNISFSFTVAHNMVSVAQKTWHLYYLNADLALDLIHHPFAGLATEPGYPMAGTRRHLLACTVRDAQAANWLDSVPHRANEQMMTWLGRATDSMQEDRSLMALFHAEEN